jgi:hypothetical protein
LRPGQEVTGMADIINCFQHQLLLFPMAVLASVFITFDKDVYSSWTLRYVACHQGELECSIAYPQKNVRMKLLKGKARAHGDQADPG